MGEHGTPASDEQIAGDEQQSPPAHVPPPTEKARRRRRHRRSWRRSYLVLTLALVSGVGGALAGSHPTGTPGLDPLYAGVLAAIVTMAASEAARWTLVLAAAIGVSLSRSWLLIPASAALLLAFFETFPRRPHRGLNALVGGMTIQVILRWPSIGFHGATALVAVVAVGPVLASAWSRQRRQTRRRIAVAATALLGLAVIISAPVVVGGLLARRPVNQALSSVRQALEMVTSGNGHAATGPLDTAASDFATAHDRTGSWWTLGGRLVPVVAQQRQALAGATNAGQRLAEAAKQSARIDLRNLSYHDGQLDLASVERLGGPLHNLDQQVAVAQLTLSRIQSPWLTAPIASRLDSFSARVQKAGHAAALGVQLVGAAPDLLGGDGVRHYFVAFMSPAEARGLDGFIGAYGELRVSQGRVSLVQAGPIGSLNPQPGSARRQIVGVPDYLARYGEFQPAQHFQDVTYAPDFPSVARVISDLYAESGGPAPDGVIALDPEALSVLLQFTGPLTVPGVPEPLTASNASAFLLKQQYADFSDVSEPGARHDYLQDALRQAFQKLTVGSLPAATTVADDLGRVVRQGRLLWWSAHPSDEALLERLGVAGSFPRPGAGSDVLAITTANAANNKLDAYLTEHVAENIEFAPENGQVSATLTIGLTNGSPRGLPPVVLGSYAGSGLPLGTNLSWLSLYTPYQLASATLDGRSITFSPGTPELGVRAYSAYVAIAQGATVNLRISLVGRLPPAEDYRLALWMQPLVNTPSMAVTVNDSPLWVPGPIEVQEHTWINHRH